MICRAAETNPLSITAEWADRTSIGSFLNAYDLLPRPTPEPHYAENAHSAITREPKCPTRMFKQHLPHVHLAPIIFHHRLAEGFPSAACGLMASDKK
eukprot:958524-Amphidinium_carterae.2